VFDALGTLLDLGPVGARFPGPLEVWFERILHTGAALTLVGEFRPFADVAEATLPTALAQVGAAPDERAALDVLRNDLRPAREANDAFAILGGLPIYVLTNGSAKSTRDALERGGLADRVQEIVSIDDVRAWKPHRAPYAELERRAGVQASELWLVAAHAWDVLAARTYGWQGVWVESLEQRWPLPAPEPEHRAPSLVAAARLVATPR
jgi:2-haloacid dehalogenase